MRSSTYTRMCTSNPHAHANAHACATDADATNADATNAHTDALWASTCKSLRQTNQAATAQANVNQASRHTDPSSSAASTPHGSTHDATYASMPSNVCSTYPYLSAGVPQTMLQEGKTGKVRAAF